LRRHAIENKKPSLSHFAVADEMNPSPIWPRRGLYLLTPDEPDTERLLARVLPALTAGAAMLQYRNKSADSAKHRQQALALQPHCRRLGIPLIINDDWGLAAEIDADGAHLGQLDGDVADARQALRGQTILGVSCHDSLDLAEAAAKAGANYLAFGAMFASGTKPDARAAPLELLRQAARFGLPRVAIGGITPDNAHSVIAAGADLIAVIGGVFEAADPALAVRRYLSCFEEKS
jgi:thiamine-phosphate pyrophosphorylase